MDKHAYVGDILAVALLPDGSVLAGAGGRVGWYGGDGALRCSTVALSRARVHGLSLHATAERNHQVVVRGGRAVSVLLASDSRLSCVWSLPPFVRWVHAATLSLNTTSVVVALSDNSVEVWSRGGRTWRSASSVRCLLYSAALLLSPAGILVAAGSISNEVLLWRASPGQEEEVATLSGHDGSVHCVCFSSCGKLVASAGDDRTAIIWTISAKAPLLTLHGHSGRVFDVQFLGGTLLATTSEDKTCRLWDMHSGDTVAVLRGPARLWTCAFSALPEPVLACGGADGSLKLWRLADWLPGAAADEASSLPEAVSDTFTRCLELVAADALLLADNRGRLHGARIPVRAWCAGLYVDPQGAPILCMRASPPLATSLCDGPARLLVGCMNGHALLFSVSATTEGGMLAGLMTRWAAQPEGRITSVFWLQDALAATADATGGVRVWRITDCEAGLLAEAEVGQRTICAAAAQEPDGALLLLCGDQRGAVSAFSIPDEAESVPGSARSVGRCVAHSGSAVTLLQHAPHLCQFLSAGADGYLCAFALVDGALRRVGRRHVGAVAAPEAALFDATGAELLAGVTADSLVVHDVRAEAQLLRLPCGGWRRPHACVLATGGRVALAFSRNRVLHVLRRWPAHSPAQPALRSMMSSHHLREIHAAAWLPCPAPGCASCIVTGSEDGMVHSAYVRDVARRDGGAGWSLDGCSRLGEAAGRSAVRALALVRHHREGWLLVTCGAREVLMGWHLCWGPDGRVRARLLASHAPQGGAAHAAETDTRFLSLAAFVADGTLFAACGASDARLALWALPLHTDSAGAPPRWRLQAEAATLRPPLAMAAFEPAPGAGWCLFSATTDGSACAWGTSPLLAGTRLARVHQTGVNAMRVARSGDPQRWLLSTGGDDGAIAILLLAVSSPRVVQVLAALRHPGAHAAACKGVWSDGTVVVTAGMDQRVHMWCVFRFFCAQCSSALTRSCRRVEQGVQDAERAHAALDAPWLRKCSSEAAPEDCVDMVAWWRGDVVAPLPLRLRRVESAITDTCEVEGVVALPAGGGYALAVVGCGVQLLTSAASRQ